MRSFLRSLGKLVLLPFRLIWAPFAWLGRGIRRVLSPAIDFFTEEPEDISITETIGEAFESRESLTTTFAGIGEHIAALRGHLLRATLALAITTGISFFFFDALKLFLERPLNNEVTLQVITPTEAVGVFMRVSLLAGLALAMPYIILEAYLFIAPGLMPRSRIMLATAIPLASLLFLAGLAFTYFVMLPPAVHFLSGFLGFKAAWRPEAYFGLVTSLMFWIGLFFQLPLVVYALTAVGLLNARLLTRYWQGAVVIIAIIAAAITPTVDPVNMALVMLPMILLYIISIGGAMIAGAGRRRDLERRERVEAGPSR